MTIYNYHRITKEYLSTGTARPNPREEDKYLIPANATIIEPSTPGANQKAVFNPSTEEWSLVSDYRGTVFYSTATMEILPAVELGDDQPADSTTIAPPTDDTRNYIIWGGSSWDEDADAKTAYELAQIEARQASLLGPTDRFFLSDRSASQDLTDWRVSVRQINDDYVAEDKTYAQALAVLDDLEGTVPSS